MKTQEEIMLRIDEIGDNDFLGFETTDLYSALTKANAIEMLIRKNPDAESIEKDLADYEQIYRTNEDIIEQMKKYMSFAVEKAVNHRGISASRSVAHYRAWTWLINDSETFEFLSDGSNYQNYGAPMLKYVAEKYDIPIPENQTFIEMAQGRKCQMCIEGLEEGCDS